MHPIKLLSGYMREELKQRIMGKGLSWEGAEGPARLQEFLGFLKPLPLCDELDKVLKSL